MKKIAIFLTFFLILPIAFADITIQTDQNIYNIGNRIKASASVLQSTNFEGLLKLTISCDGYKLQYFLTPISLEANFRSAINVPELAVTSSMLGNCSITGDLLTNDNLVIEEKKSNGFAATNQLNVLPASSKITALPSETIQISGIVNEAYGNNALKATTKISMGNSSYAADAVDGKFSLPINIPKNIKSGNHIIEVAASDAKGNSGSALVELEVIAVPTYIKIGLSNNELLPGSKISIIPSLYDQADDLINTSLDLELASPDGSNIFKKAAQSNDKLEYEFSQHAEPGIYILAVSYKNLFAQTAINITAIREVKVKYENETVIVENTGNVVFEDELTFVLESDLKKYPITKKIKIEPGKIIDVDLSQEVPYGIYNVIAPLKEGLEPVKEKVDEFVQGTAESVQESISNLLPKQNVLAGNVTIHDNRPIYKKIASGLASISGSLVGADGVLTKNPLIAPMILVVIVLLIIFRYGRKPILRLIKGKKDDEVKKE